MQPFRIFVLALVIGPLLTGYAVSRDDPAEASWKNKRVYIKKPASEIEFTSKENGKKIDFRYKDVFLLTVIDEKESKLLIFDGYANGWASKNDFVLESDAKRFYTERIDRDPQDSFAFLMRGVANFYRDNDEGMKDLAESIRLNPKNSAAYIARGNLHTLLAFGEYSAYEYYKSIPDNNAAGEHLNIAEDHVSKAINNFDKALAIDPKNDYIYRCRRDAWFSIKDYDKSLAEINEAIRIDPKYEVNYYARAGVLIAKREKRKAIEDISEGISLSSDNASGFVMRARIWSDLKEYDKAIKDFGEAIRLNPTDYNNYTYRASIWDLKKEYDKVIADYDSVLKLNPKLPYGYRNRGNAWFQKREFEKAINDYDKAILLYPKAFPKFMLAEEIRNRGYIKMAKGDYKKVIQDCEEAIRNDSKGAYSYILGYMAARHDKDENAALKFVDDAKANAKRDSWPYPVVEFLSGDIDEKALAKHFDSDNNRTEGHCYLGLYHALAGRKDEAKGHFRWVKENGITTYFEYALCLEGLKSLDAEKAK